MSLLCRKKMLPVSRVGLGLVLLSTAGISAPAQAAQFYVQPEADVSVDVATNRTLIPVDTPTDHKVTGEGYAAEAGGTLGYDTPVTDTTFRGVAGYHDYPQNADHELEGVAEFASEYRWLTSTFSASGRFDRLNTISSELANPLFDPLVPTNLSTPETGRVSQDTTRTLTDVAPRFSHRFSDRFSVGVAATLEQAYYSGLGSSNYSSYSYGLFSAAGNYSITPRLDLSAGPFVSRDLAREGEASVTGTGGNIGLKYRQSSTLVHQLDLSGESDDNTILNESGVGTQKVTNHAFGATYTAGWRGQISQVNISVGRQLTPSGNGGEYFANQLQIEYQHSLSERLEATAAARAIKYSALVSQAQSASYKYVDATVALKWLMTRTFFLNGGVEYVRMDYGGPVQFSNTGTGVAAISGGAANNFRAFIGFGYLGLGPKSALTYPY